MPTTTPIMRAMMAMAMADVDMLPFDDILSHFFLLCVINTNIFLRSINNYCQKMKGKMIGSNNSWAKLNFI
jgi:hypothetical protein